MTASDLHSRLLSTIQERLTLAQAATPGPWEVTDPNEGSEYPPFWMVTNDAFHNPPADEDAPWIAFELHTGVEADARFVASNDPSSVIRQCKRDLRVLERHTPEPAMRSCDYCASLCHSRSGLMCDQPDAPWPCPEIRDLAESLGIDVGE